MCGVANAMFGMFKTKIKNRFHENQEVKVKPKKQTTKRENLGIFFFKHLKMCFNIE